MKVIIVICAVLAYANAGVLAPAAAVVRAPSFDSAVIQSDRLGGNFAYSVAENHAYAAVSPIVQNVATPVAVSYSAPAVAAYAAPAAVAAAPVAYSTQAIAAAPVAYSAQAIAAAPVAYSAPAVVSALQPNVVANHVAVAPAQQAIVVAK